jgi:hypothetical protein
MKKGDKIVMEFQYLGLTSYEEAIIKNITREGITLEDTYFNTKDTEEDYLFSLNNGKCLNEPKTELGGKRRLINNP